MNMLTDELPEAVYIDDIKYEIRCDFRTAIRFSAIMQSHMSDDEKTEKTLQLYYVKRPHSTQDALLAVLSFYSQKTPEEITEEIQHKDDKGKEEKS